MSHGDRLFPGVQRGTFMFSTSIQREQSSELPLSSVIFQSAAWLSLKAITMPGSSEAPELERISVELNHLSFKRQQLNDRRNMVAILREYKSSSNYKHTGEGAGELSEMDHIDMQLSQVAQKKKELQDCYDKILQQQTPQRKDDIRQGGVPVLPHCSEPYVIFIENPPTTSAPKVILDISELPPYPSRTQCPECRQFIITEIVTSVGHVACLVCVMMALIGCLAGCCFIPFCVNTFKDVTHRCPKCRSSIHTNTKL